MDKELERIAEENANNWLNSDIEEVTKCSIRQMRAETPHEFFDAFYKNLEFGTGGLRGIMGVGTNRMNKFTVGMATQGYANYLKECFQENIAVAVGHDSRNHSDEFAHITADIFAANGFKVYLFESLRPTPELSFAIRNLHCKGGVVITASHNPKEYNGYKAYWEDGAQVLAPHDKNIIAHVNRITSSAQVRWNGQSENIELLGEEFDRTYLNALSTLLLTPEAVRQQRDMKIVYTPIHGTGITLVPKMLANMGFQNVIIVKEQATPDGNFPTVESPNPEERSAMNLAIETARRESADLVVATDPDADRIGIAIRNDQGEYILLNGNQTGSLLMYYILSRWQELGRLNGKQYTVKTIVTSELFGKISESFGVRYFDVLTGFKYIAEVIRNLEGNLQYICGGEESYGFLIGDTVRDKDAVIATAMTAEMAAWAKCRGMSMFDLLGEMYLKFGFYKEGLVSLVKKGSDGQKAIKAMMDRMRNNPPRHLAGEKIIRINDFLRLQSHDLITSTVTSIEQHQSDVLQYITENGTIVSTRPSGTEPKIKFYFCTHEPLNSLADFHSVETQLDAKIEQIKKDLALD